MGRTAVVRGQDVPEIPAAAHPEILVVPVNQRRALIKEPPVKPVRLEKARQVSAPLNVSVIHIQAAPRSQNVGAHPIRPGFGRVAFRTAEGTNRDDTLESSRTFG